jgi:hypothetical protein
LIFPAATVGTMNAVGPKTEDADETIADIPVHEKGALK